MNICKIEGCDPLSFVSDEHDRELAARMAVGQPCRPDGCDEGCGA